MFLLCTVFSIFIISSDIVPRLQIETVGPSLPCPLNGLFYMLPVTCLLVRAKFLGGLCLILLGSPLG